MKQQQPDFFDRAAQALKPKPKEHFDSVMEQLDQRFGPTHTSMLHLSGIRQADGNGHYRSSMHRSRDDR